MKECNRLLYAQNNMLDAEKLTFNENTASSLFGANKNVCLNSYLTFKDEVNRMSEYEKLEDTNLICCIKSIKYVGPS